MLAFRQHLLIKQLFGLQEQAVDWTVAVCWAVSDHSGSIEDEGALLTKLRLFSGAQPKRNNFCHANLAGMRASYMKYSLLLIQDFVL